MIGVPEIAPTGDGTSGLEMFEVIGTVHATPSWLTFDVEIDDVALVVEIAVRL
jgi:hypothetical protein